MPLKEDASGADTNAVLALVTKAQLQNSFVTSCSCDQMLRTRAWNAKRASGMNLGQDTKLTITEKREYGFDLAGKHTHDIRNVVVTALDNNGKVIGTATSSAYGTLLQGSSRLGFSANPTSENSYPIYATTKITACDGMLKMFEGRKVNVFYNDEADPALKALEIAAKKK